MILIGSLGLSIFFMLLGMFCMGTWPNFFKWHAREVYKEHMFIIYSIFAFVVSVVAAFTFGSYGDDGINFLDNLRSAYTTRILAAVAGGVCIALSNLFMVFGNELSGIAIAMPISSGISIIGGTLLNYVIDPIENVALLVVGILFVIVALVFDSASIMQKQKYQRNQLVAKDVDIQIELNKEQPSPNMRGQSADQTSEEPQTDKFSKGAMKKGVLCSIFSGVIGCFWSPAGTYSMQFKGEFGSLSAYTSFFFFMIGFLVTGVATNFFYMYRPINREPTNFSAMFKMKTIFWVLAIVAGVINGIGNLLNFVAGQSSGGFAVSFAIARANTLVSGLYGVFLWKEFENTNTLAKVLYVFGALFYIGALVTLSFSL